MGVTNCYYASKQAGASDSNNGTSESTPFLHVPGMFGCTATCASVTPAAGTGMIMRGGDTWTNSELGIYWAPGWSGNASHLMYIGFDITWFVGGSWARPIFNMQNLSFIGAYGQANPSNCALLCDWGNYTVFDNIEVTGSKTIGNGAGNSNTSGTLFHFTGAQNSHFQRMYVHGWSHDTAANGDYDSPVGYSDDSSSTGSCYHDNIADGSDTTKDMIHYFYGHVSCIYNNYLAWVADASSAAACNWHDNWFNNSPQSDAWQGVIGHINLLSIQGPAECTTQFIYNNLLTNAFSLSPAQGAGSGGGMWFNNNIGSSITGNVMYAFNNVNYANNVGFSGIGPVGHNNVNYGTYYIFNNTIECGQDTNLCSNGTNFSSGSSCDGPPNGSFNCPATVFFGNNHGIGSDTAGFICTNGSVCSTPAPFTNDILQTLSTANGQGYNDANGFAPQTGSVSTVHAGGNASSVCSTITGLNAAAGTACSSGTGFACSYNTTNHKLTCPAITENARGSTWDTGAYQFASAGASFFATPAIIPSQHSKNIAVALTGSGTSWTGGTAFSISGVTGATLVSKSNSSSTSETLQITTGSGTGTLTITDTTDSISTTISVSAATLVISPTSGSANTTPTLTMTGTNTLWQTDTGNGNYTTSNLFSESGGTGASLGTATITSNTTATAVLTAGSTNATETITDNSTTATATFTVAAVTLPTATTSTTTSFLQATSVNIVGNSYVCTGGCAAVTSEGTCYGLSSNPTAPCTSDGTVTPWNSSLIGLSPGTTYHYRAKATNSVGTAYGNDQTFTTPVMAYVPNGCVPANKFFAASGSGSFSCAANAVGDAVVFFAQCHPTASPISGITLTSPGWTITQRIAPASTGSNSWGATFVAIAPDTTLDPFVATFTGASDCNNFSIVLGGEFSGNDKTGGTTTFNAVGSNSGAASTCNQTAANITPPLGNESVWAACLLGSATTATAPWTLGAADGVGNSAEYQVLSGGAGVAQTPAFNGTSGAYIVEGVAIAPLTTVPSNTNSIQGGKMTSGSVLTN
jgi:hypothetical protein